MYSNNRENISILYVSIFISLLFNIHKLLRIFGDITAFESNWNFDLYELLFQVQFQIIFCYLIGVLFVRKIQASTYKKFNNLKSVILIILFTLASWFIISITQEIIFDNVSNQKLFYRTYLIRFLLSAVLMYLTSRMLILNRQNKLKELENEKLKSSYLNSKLENLKNQINPHFLFNSFANLSALIDVNQKKAKRHLSNLSYIFRYTLNNSNEQIVDLTEELDLFNSYLELHKIRFEDSISVQIDTSNKQAKIISMSLQPLLENVIKHNEISLEKPICIRLKQDKNVLVFENNLNKKNRIIKSNSIGLSNLNERYKILLGKEINIQKTKTHFIVKLPLI